MLSIDTSIVKCTIFSKVDLSNYLNYNYPILNLLTLIVIKTIELFAGVGGFQTGSRIQQHKIKKALQDCLEQPVGTIDKPPARIGCLSG